MASGTIYETIDAEDLDDAKDKAEQIIYEV